MEQQLLYYSHHFIVIMPDLAPLLWPLSIRLLWSQYARSLMETREPVKWSPVSCCMDMHLSLESWVATRLKICTYLMLGTFSYVRNFIVKKNTCSHESDRCRLLVFKPCFLLHGLAHSIRELQQLDWRYVRI
jgi:hypothetical protein